MENIDSEFYDNHLEILQSDIESVSVKILISCKT